MEIFMLIALSLFKTLESIETPCSVKANGRYLVPPLCFEVLKLHLKASHSMVDNGNIKSEEVKWGQPLFLV